VENSSKAPIFILAKYKKTGISLFFKVQKRIFWGISKEY
jgi:hypothetical protein